MATRIATQTAHAQLILRSVIWGVGVGREEHLLSWVGGSRESIGNRSFIASLR